MTKRPMELMQRGFTLVELLIVVIILAILAAIVIPQFTSATADAQESALDANLAGLRSAIELYKVQHNNKYPGAVAATGATCAAGSTAGTGAINTAQAVIDQLTKYSNASGQTCDAPGGTVGVVLGPYLRKGIPTDPITNTATIATPTTAGLPIVPAAATGGWAYDVTSGQFVMNSNATDSKGKAYSTH